MKIKLSNMEQIEKLVNICESFNEDIDLSSGHIIVDAKSFMGVTGMGTEKELTITINSNDNTIKDSFYSKIEEFLKTTN